MPRTKGLPPGDHRHGTTSGYCNYACRCALCRSAWAERMRSYMARRRARFYADGLNAKGLKRADAD